MGPCLASSEDRVEAMREAGQVASKEIQSQVGKVLISETRLGVLLGLREDAMTLWPAEAAVLARA